MQRIVTCAAGLYWWIAKVSSEIHIFTFDTLYLREQGCEDPWLFFEASKKVWETML